MRRVLAALAVLPVLAIVGCESESPQSPTSGLSATPIDGRNDFTCMTAVLRRGGGFQLANGRSAEADPYSILAVRRAGETIVHYEKSASGKGPTGALDLRDPDAQAVRTQFTRLQGGEAEVAGTSALDVESIQVIYPARNGKLKHIDACLVRLLESTAEKLGAPVQFGFWYASIPVPPTGPDGDASAFLDRVQVAGFDGEGETLGTDQALRP